MSLSDDVKQDLLLACRHGDLEDVQTFVTQYGAEILLETRDDNGNSVLHMISANGHVGILDFLLPLLPSSFLATRNNSGSTPLHWAALNSQLEIAQKIVRHPGIGVDLIDVKNEAGRSPLGEAELAGWDEGARWFVEVMNLGAESGHETAANEEVLDSDTKDIEVEIEDADGKIAKMTISGRARVWVYLPSCWVCYLPGKLQNA
ncbi:ankyrin repeat-containing domain protein [Crepidotus variabilis]|uniref:Ankyrin repeat-containing domain protein n=1 Tax=Crepidotus variabilis TaxID=179855 RepID=A0A9P6JQL1_9AGAR|nr:ankyrin repeat-containing domain protein [Crepidotus variabilis]